MSDDQPVASADAGYTLIVGGETKDRAWVESTLMRSGLVVSLGSEADVLATPNLLPPHLVVLDDQGNRETRGATVRRLQAHPALKGVPFLVLAYDTDIESFTEALTRGVACYLVKPVSPEELATVAHKLTGWQSSNENTERRRRLRRPLIMRIDVDVRSRKVRTQGEIVDVSGTGCRIEIDERVETGETLRIILQAHEGSTHVALGAEVRWVRTTPNGRWQVGARFTGTTALLAGKILGFVSSGTT